MTLPDPKISGGYTNAWLSFLRRSLRDVCVIRICAIKHSTMRPGNLVIGHNLIEQWAGVVVLRPLDIFFEIRRTL